MMREVAVEYILEVARYREVGSQSWVSEKGYWGERGTYFLIWMGKGDWLRIHLKDNI